MTPERWELLEPLIDAALDLVPEQRDAYLDVIRADSPALGAEVARLLTEVDGASSLLERAATERFGLLLGDAPMPMPALLDGRFAVDRELGRGGMSIVYAAHDREYDRAVAVKVLRSEIVATLGVDRFQHEIKILAKLQHPHIVPLFSAGVVNGRPYFIMPLVEGESLRARLARGGLPVADVVSILRDVCKALAYAHAHRVVHRDIKPDNVMLSGDAALVTDFGIAKAIAESLKSADLQGTNENALVTQAGTLVGTPTYMAPEQATGSGTADERSDLYALGCLAYELLTGAPPFGSRPLKDIVRAHIEEVPRPIDAARVDVPPTLAALIMRCLEKSPDARPQSAREVLRALEDSDAVSSADGASVTRRRFAWGGTAVMTAALLVAGIIVAWRSRRVDPDTVRFVVSVPSNQRPEESQFGPPIALSPDGRDLVYVGRAATGAQLYIRRLDQRTTQPIEGTAGGDAPFFSPDGTSLGYWAGSKIRKIPIAGGVSIPLTDAWFIFGATWVRDDLIVIGSHPTDTRLAKINAAGGDPRPFPVARVGQWPVTLPGGKLFLFTGDSGTISLVGPDDSIATSLGVRGQAVGVLDHWLVYTRAGGALMAVDVDLGRRRVTGTPVQVLDSILVRSAAVAANGTLVYIRRSTVRRASLVDISSSRAHPLTMEPQDLRFPVLSPDGRRIAFEMPLPGGSDIFLYDLASMKFNRLTFGLGAERPSWTPDGKRVGFTRNAPSSSGASWIRADGNGPASVLYDSLPGGTDGINELTFSPDGRSAVMRDGAALTKRDLWLLPLNGQPGVARVATPLERGTFNELMPRISPDGRRLAFVSDSSGSNEVYVRPFPENGAHVRVSIGGGMEPVWAPDGAAIFYRSNGKFVKATFAAGSPPVVAVRRELFEDKYVASTRHQQFDVTRDGRKLLVLDPAEENGEEISVIIGWLRELRRQMAGTNTSK